jgi:hypothetical protein
VNRLQRREGRNHLPPPEPYGNSENSWEQQVKQEQQERQNAKLEQNRDALNVIKRNKNLLPCQWNNQDCHDTSKDTKRSYSSFFQLKKEQGLVAFNSFSHDRYWCQQFIPAYGGLVEFNNDENDKPCHEPPRLFYKTPSVSGKGLKPTTVWYNDPYHSSQPKTVSDCKIPCRVGGDFDLVSQVTISNTPFQFIASMEGEAYYSNVKIKPTAYQDHLYYATTSFRSEVPLPYYSEAEYPRLQSAPAVDYNSAIKGASFLANNCDSFSNREELVQALQQTTRFRVDSLSKCLHNAKLPPGIVDASNKGLILSKYLFHLSFENQRIDDYITEKLWGAFQSGTVPVYFGAPNIKDHVPPHSIISVDDFDTPLALANYLSKVSKDKTLYDSYHEWRQLPTYLQKYNFTKQHSHCRLCQWGYANQYGFAWNHNHQIVQEPMISRKTCRNKKGLIGYPFKEYWKKVENTNLMVVPVLASNGGSVKTCTFDDSNRRLDIDGGALQRAVYTQDGVADFYISGDTTPNTGRGGQQSTYTLTLETPISSAELQKSADEKQHWWLQDGQSRMTILISTSQPGGVELRLVKSGSVDLAISSSSSLIRVRVISEDVDNFHQGAKNRPTYFGKLLTDDFFHPLETYKVV